MALIRECDMQRMMQYKSYDMAILTPILFPLLVALLVQATAWAFMWRERHKTQRSASILCGGELLVETFFGIFCLGSCLANYSQKRYVGEECACAFQAWYAGWYTFSQLPLLGALGAVIWHREFSEAKSLPPIWASAAIVVGSLVVGAVVAALPFFGLSHFVFPKDYCMYDLQDTPYAVLFLLFFIFSAGCVALGPLRLSLPACMGGRASNGPAGQALAAAAVLLFLWGWGVAAAIAVRGLAHGSFCGDAFATSSTIYGFNAVFLHVQQLANPLLYGVMWRRALSTGLTSESVASGTKVVDIDIGGQAQGN